LVPRVGGEQWGNRAVLLLLLAWGCASAEIRLPPARRRLRPLRLLRRGKDRQEKQQHYDRRCHQHEQRLRLVLAKFLAVCRRWVQRALMGLLETLKNPLQGCPGLFRLLPAEHFYFIKRCRALTVLYLVCHDRPPP